MLEQLGNGLLAIVSGGATGILGIISQRIFDHWKNKQELDRLKVQHEHERAMRQLDRDIMKEEYAQRTKLAQVEGETAREVAETQAFGASLLKEPERFATGERPKGKVGAWGWFMLAVVDAVRGSVRPGLTIYLAWISTAIYLQSVEVLARVNPSAHTELLLKLHEQIVLTLLYLFVTCVLWWFGTRNKSPQPKLG